MTLQEPRLESEKPQSTFTYNPRWEKPTPSAVKRFSAVAYLTAVGLNTKKGVPVGVVQCAYGELSELATPPFTLQCVALTSSDHIQIDFRTFHVYILHVSWLSGGTSILQWLPVEVLAALTVPETKRSQPKYNVYNGMVYPLIGAEWSGVVWYQVQSSYSQSSRSGLGLYSLSSSVVEMRFEGLVTLKHLISM